MALNATTLYSSIPCKSCFLPKPKYLYLNSTFSPASSSCFGVNAFSEHTEGGLADQEDLATYSGSFSSAQTQLDLLDQLTSSGSSSADGSRSGGNNTKLTIRDQLAQLVGNRDDDFTIPLGKDLKKISPKFLTISQKRNIRRQTYLNEVSQRNDSSFFATIGAFVLLPPLLILGIAIATGYVQLFP
ncbi:Vacuolar protein sorting-associated protein 16-like protein [Heracleum sosnowskyi]|uniref:Vacuolar protein sorting-associated protein 16-like protein n=1 Tax=Heracleum sosnowskyi TaxID=360622 RepID=A0AAD8JHZ1_9APIA|nr:Vacuolar protein sorting-associated protein 16-like protein [Heracleum sosnowskyi]